MATRVNIKCENEYLFRKIQIELSEKAEVIRAESDRYSEDEIFLSDEGDALFVFIKGKCYREPYPLPLGRISEIIFSPIITPGLSIYAEGAILNGEPIPLTELEYKLYKLLYEKGGFISRDELTLALWEDKDMGGCLNVYIHYLRQKLERGEERIILSSRKYGYRLNPSFMKGADPNADTY